MRNSRTNEETRTVVETGERKKVSTGYPSLIFHRMVDLHHYSHNMKRSYEHSDTINAYSKKSRSVELGNCHSPLLNHLLSARMEMAR